MDIQKDINKEVLKSDEEKVEDLAKDAEDLEKAVEKDIEDKVEKVEEVNDAKAEPLDAKDGSGKTVKDVVASDKEFKEEQEHEDVEFPEVKKSEFVTEKLKPFTEKLELNEAAETQTEIKELLSDYLLNELEESEFMDNLAWRAEKEVSGYNHDWCAEEASSEYKEKEYEFIDELVEDLMAMCPLEESLKENKLNKSDEDNETNIRDLKDFSWKELEGLKGKTIRALKNIEYGEVLDFDEEDMPNFKKAGLRVKRSGDIIIPKGWQGEIVYTYSYEGINPELGIEVNDEYIPLAIAGGKAGEFSIIDNIDSLKENKLNESDEEDLRKDANSLSDYLSKNKLYCDLEDYEMYPLGVKVVTFRVEGDWKHDHWYFNDLVEKWAKENGKEIWKIDENTVEEDGSDYYTADHKVYITDKETSDRLNSMRGLFAPKEESLKEGHYGQITLDVAKKMDNGDYMAVYKWPSGRISFGLAAYIYAIYESIKNDLGADKCNPYYAKNSSMYIDYLIDNYSKESVNKAVAEFKKYGVELKPTVKYPWYDKKGVSQYFRITNVDENKLLNSTLNNYSVIKSKEEVDKYLNQYFKDLSAIKAAEDAEWVAKQAQSSTDGTKEESLKEDLMRSSWGSNFQSDVYNALADIAFKYYKKNINITEDDWSEAIEWFMTHFFEDEQIYDESLKEDLMGTAWGSNFKSDVYNALSKIAFKYYRKDINITDDDWNEAVEWFMTHFFESDDNPFGPFGESLHEGRRIDFDDDIVKVYDGKKVIYHGLEDYEPMNNEPWVWNSKDGCYYLKTSGKTYKKVCEESLEEAVSPDLINAIMWYYGCSKTEANKQAKGMSEERKKLLIQTFEDNAKKSFYSESLKEDTATKHDLDILKPYLPSDFQYRQFYSVILVRKDIGTFMEALRKDGWKLISYPTATELGTENNVFVGSAIFSKDNLNIYVWESESPKVCYVRLLDKSLDESKLDEAIPREVAQALKNSSGLEIKNSGGAYYRIPGSTDSKYSNLDPKTALNNSRVDYANAEFNKISKEEAFNLFKTEPQNLLLIVKDYGRNSDKAIWFDENGNRSGRVETVPLEIAPVRRDGEPIRDTKYMTPKQLIGCASACYWTNQREVLRDPDIEKERHQNPESKYYTGDSVSDVVKAASPKYRDSYGIDNRSFRGVEMPSRYNWRPYNEREYQRVKTDLNTWQTRLDSGELSPEDRRYALVKINELEKDFKNLEKDRSKYYNDIKDYKANVRNLTMLKSKDYLKKLLDLRAKVKDSDDELRNAKARLATVRNQGGTWSNSYDRRQVARYESQIEELKAQIARYQKYIEDLNAKLNSQQVSEEDAREIANAEADVNRIKSEIEGSKNELDAVLNRARARRQQNTESLEEDLKVTLDFSSFRPWGRAEDTYNRIKDAGKLDEADAILEELYPEGISEDSLNAILAHEPEWLLNELGLADEEEVAMLDLDEE